MEKIQREIEHRKLVVRPEAIKAVQVAREQGDLSENFEYYAAKRDKNANESRIRYLERILKNATVITAVRAEGVVGINDEVTVYLPEDDEEETYRIVTSIRGNTLENRISIESPLGKALIGRKVGDEVTVQVNDRYSFTAKIIRIVQSQGEDDDTIRAF